MISEAKPENLNKITAIHQSVLKGTLASRMGEPFVASLYRLLIDNGSLSKVFIEKEVSVIKGFVSLTQNRLEVNTRVNQLLGFFEKLHLAFFVLLHQQAMNKLYNKFMLDRYIAKIYKDVYPSILTLGVSPKYRGRGIGRTLILRADKYFKEHGFSKYFVDTEVENKGTIQFYLKLGFKPVITISGNIILEKVI